MPCFTDGAESDGQREIDRRKVEAALCAVLSVAESTDKMDWLRGHFDGRGAGVSWTWVEAWWADHKRKDAVREAEEARNLAAANERLDVLRKLTPAERRAIGYFPFLPEDAK